MKFLGAQVARTIGSRASLCRRTRDPGSAAIVAFPSPGVPAAAAPREPIRRLPKVLPFFRPGELSPRLAPRLAPAQGSTLPPFVPCSARRRRRAAEEIGPV
ncbi:unnamed protein product [Ixodes pacificus]